MARPKKESKIRPMDKIGKVEFVTSGIPELDALVGGFPRKRYTLVYGLPSVGKTTLMIRCLAAISKSAKVLFIDAESAVSAERVAALGADLSAISYTNTSQLEEAAEMTREALADHDIVIIDSLAMLSPRAEMAGETGEQFVGLKPRLIGQWMRQMTEALGNSNCAVVIVNQIRFTMNPFGDPTVMPGGMQPKFSSSLTLRLSTTSKDKIYGEAGEKQRIGHWVNVIVEKNKVGTPYTTTKFKLIY